MDTNPILWPLTSSKIIVLVAQPILTDSGPSAWGQYTRGQNWAGQVAGEKGGPPPSVKVAHVYVVLRYSQKYWIPSWEINGDLRPLYIELSPTHQVKPHLLEKIRALPH